MLWETSGVHPQGVGHGGFGGHPPTQGMQPRPGERGAEQRGGGPDCGEGRCDLATVQAYILSNPLFVSIKVLAVLINSFVVRVKVCRNSDSSDAPQSLWREVQDTAGGLPSSVPTLCHCSTRFPHLQLAKTGVVRSRYWWVSICSTPGPEDSHLICF